MPEILKRRSTPPILALSAVVLLVVVFVLLNGGGSKGAANSGLAGYMPPDSVAYAETDLRPDGRVAAGLDQGVRTLTGRSLSASLDEAFSRSNKSGIDYRRDIEPWLAGPVAVSTGASRTEAGLVAEASDVDAVAAFAEGLSAGGDLPDGAQAEVVGDALVVASSQAWLDRMREAFAGESLADTPVFTGSMADLPEGGVASLFISNAALLRTIESEDFALSPILETLGIEPEGTGTAMTLSIDGNVVSLQGSSGLATGVGMTGADELIESFPADSLLAAGSGNVGESLSALIETVDQTGAAPEGTGAGEGADSGQGVGPDAGGLLGQASAFGIDLPELIASIESAGVFVTGENGKDLGGALVAITSDPELVGETIDSVTSLGAFAGPDFFRPLPDGLDGFSVALPGMPAGRVAVAADGDRLAVALGVKAARQALDPGARSLGDTGLYREATSTLSGQGVSLFATPSAIVPLIAKKADSYGGPAHGGKAGAKRMKRLIEGIETVVAGSGEGGSFEVDLGLKD